MRSLQIRKSEEYKIYLLPLENEKAGNLKGGWLDDSLRQNSYIYGRTSKDEASIFSKEKAISIVRKCTRLGYPAKCDPPITINETL